MPLYLVGAVLGIYAVCACVELARLALIEKPLMAAFDAFMNKKKAAQS